MDKVVTKMDPYNTHDDHIELPEPQIYPVDDGGHMVERVIPEAITTTTVAKERFIVRPAGGDLYNTLMEVTHTSVNKGDSKDDASIVLDIAGYKTGGGDDDEWNQDNQVFATPDAAEALEKEMTQLLLDENVVQSPPALDGLEPADQRVDDAKQQSHDRGETSYQTAQDSSVVVVEEEQQQQQEPKKSLWGWGSAKRQATNDSIEAPLSPPTRPTTADDDTLALLPGQIYRIEMSLCGFSAFGKDEQENATVFDQHKVTYDDFTHNPSMLNDKRLVFRYNNRYYAAGRTGPLFTSLLLYKKPLEETPQDEEEAADSRVSYSYGTGKINGESECVCRCSSFPVCDDRMETMVESIFGSSSAATSNSTNGTSHNNRRTVRARKGSCCCCKGGARNHHIHYHNHHNIRGMVC